MRKAIPVRHLAAALIAAALPLHGAAAQDSTQQPAQAAVLTIDLNALQPSDRGCRFTFVATNELGGELSRAAFELVLFDTDGMVSRLTVVDFKDLPQGKTKVRQFDFSGIDCATIGRVLVNDSTECAGTGIDPRACIQNLKPQTRTEVVFGL